MKLIAAVAMTLAVGAALSVPGEAVSQAARNKVSSCSPIGDLSFVCGLTNVEDLLPVNGGRWLVAGAYKAGSAGLYRVDPVAKTAKDVALSVGKPDPIYAGCSAPDLKGLETHGLDVVPGAGAVATVYAVNHGGRESVEIFRLDASKNSAEWVGCVKLPENTSGNSVAAVPQGGFVVTKFLDPNDKTAFQKILSGQVNGVVYRWMPGKGFSEVPGTQLSGDNGIVVSKDGQWVFVNAYGTNEIYRVPLSGGGQRSSVKVDFHPDNLRWAPDGKIFVTGQLINPSAGPDAPQGWATASLDPQTMKVTPVVKEEGLPEFGGATTAVQVGKTLWFGTYRGDRIAYRAAP
jgi:hypothetical protein